MTDNNAVMKWLLDLRVMTENECLCVLQAKSLANKLVKFRKNIPYEIYISQIFRELYLRTLGRY
jgi:hypothetical protein